LHSKLQGMNETCLTCSLSSQVLQHAFNFVHIDIWGTYKELIQGKYKYFLTIGDHYSRATWTYLIKWKSHSLIIWTVFQHYIQNHLQKEIKTIWSNNILKIYSQPLSRLFCYYWYYFSSNKLCS